MKHPLIQEAIDCLLPLAGRARCELGPDDDVTFLLGKAVDVLLTGKGRKPRTGGRKRSVKARLANGTRISVPAEMVEDNA